MITETLFVKSDVEPALRELSCKSHEFSVIKENAIYYAAGYLVQKLIKKFRRSSDINACIYTGVLLHMVGDDISGAIQKNDSYLEYVKAWTKAIEHGGLRHASEDTYRFFLVLETRVYELIKRGEQKEKLVVRPWMMKTSFFFGKLLQTCQIEGSLLNYCRK